MNRIAGTEPALQESVSEELALEDVVLEGVAVLDKGDQDCVDDEDERTTDTVVDDLTTLLLATPHVPNPAWQPVPQ